jgi:hypothetical protein
MTTPAPKDRPIIFSAPMVRALLDGRKSQTRRYQFDDKGRLTTWGKLAVEWANGQRDQRVYVRESWAVKRFEPCMEHERDWQSLIAPTIRYLADGTEIAMSHGDRSTGRGIYHGPVEKGKPSIHLPRWASRLTLIVTDVRVQRLNDISEADAMAEGAGLAGDNTEYGDERNYCEGFQAIWESLHGPEAWAANPWVVAISFKTIRANIDAPEARAA